MAPTQNHPGIMDKMKTTSVNPMYLGIAVLLLALILGYLFWLRPAQQAAKDQKEFLSEEAVKQRSPEGRPSNPVHDKFIQELRSREQGSQGNGVVAPQSRRRN